MLYIILFYIILCNNIIFKTLTEFHLDNGEGKFKSHHFSHPVFDFALSAALIKQNDFLPHRLTVKCMENK